MKVLSKLCVAGSTLLTLDGNILKIDAAKVCVDGKEYDFDVAYDMDNTIGIKTENVVDNEVIFI